MARAKGSTAKLRMEFETTYGTKPSGNWKEVPFASYDHGATQGLVASELLGQGGDPADPSQDVIQVRGGATVPVDQRNIGYWLKGALGDPVTSNVRATGSIAFSTQPAANATIALNGTVWTFVSGAPAGNQTQIGASLSATLTQLAADLNASADAQVSKCTYSATATALNLSHDVAGAAGNVFTLAASASPASNGTVSGAALAGGGYQHLFRSGGPRARGTIAFSAQPANNATITLGSVTWTFVTGTPAGNQTRIQGALADTLTQLELDLNASADATLARATFGSTTTMLVVELDEPGMQPAFTLAASTSPASNGTVSGAQLALADGLPSFSAELALPDADDPSWFVTSGNKAGSIAFNFERSGHAQAQLQLVGQGETRHTATQAGTPTVAALARFGQFQGSIKKGGAAIANVTAATLAYDNNLEPVATIRSDLKIEGVDEGVRAATGGIDARFADVDALLVPAEGGAPVDLEFAYVKSAHEKLTFTLPRVFLPKPKQAVTGPGGVSARYDWQAAKDSGSAAMLRAVLRNDVTTY